MANTSNKKQGEKYKNLLGPMDPAIDKQAVEKLVNARVHMLINHAFFGTLATRLKLINADEWLPTLATDGRNFYYNSRFVMKLRKKELVFGFAHEVLHCVYDHFGRREHREPQLWNIAGDYCINADLVKHNVGEKITTIEILYDTKYAGMTAEAVYADLYDKADKINLDDLIDKLLDDHLDGEGDDGDGQGQGGTCPTCGGSGEVEDDGDGDGKDGKGKGGKDGKDQKGKGGGDGDDHDDSDGHSHGNGKPCPTCGGTGRKGRPKLTQEERDRIRDEFKEAVISAAANEPDAGNIPGNVRKMLKDLTEPQMDWRELLQLTLTSAMKDDYTFMRPSRRSWHIDAILPGMNPGEEVEIAVAVDTSGSISDKMLRDFLGEVKGCMEAFTSYKIHVFCFDTDGYEGEQYDSDNIKDIGDFEIKGRGGTDFVAIFDYMKKREIEASRLVVFTDGYPFGSWGDPDYCDTLWIIHGSTTIEAPFGVTAYYKDHLKDK